MGNIKNPSKLTHSNASSYNVGELPSLAKERFHLIVR